MIFHAFYQRINRFQTIVVGGVFRSQRICFVDKKYPAKRLFYYILYFECSLSYISGHHTGPVHLHQLSFGKNADLMIDFSQKSCHCCFAGSGVSGKHQVQTDGRHFQSHFFTNIADPYQIDQRGHVIFHLFQPDQAVQIIQQFFQGFFSVLFLRSGAFLFPGTGPVGFNKLTPLIISGRCGQIIQQFLNNIPGPDQASACFLCPSVLHWKYSSGSLKLYAVSELFHTAVSYFTKNRYFCSQI